MKGKDDHNQEANFIEAPMSTFVQYYNENIPASFPRATLKALQQFKESHRDLFKGGDKWTIDKHRKKLMDWLTANEILQK